MLDIRALPNRNGKWHCPKCNTWSDSDKPRCSWCSAARQDVQIAEANDKEARLTQLLHNAIEKMSYPQKVKAWNMLENDVV